MDQESIVYGCIKDSAALNEEVERRRNNRRALLDLPRADDWPFLSQEMFSIPSLDLSSGRYQTDVVHFGASYKAVEYEWEQWIAAFEDLLKQMYWVSATVHLETELSGTHTFVWNAHSDSHIPGTGNMKIHCEWSRENAIGF